MLYRFAVAVTALELVLTLGASVLIRFTEPPTGFLTETDLSGLGIPFQSHDNSRTLRQDVVCYDTYATLNSPPASLYASLRTDSTATDFEFRRQREEAMRERTDLGKVVLINEPLPGEEGYAVRFRGPGSVRFELVRRRGREMLIVRVTAERPFDTKESAALSKCEIRARAVQEHLMFKMRWRD